MNPISRSLLAGVGAAALIADLDAQAAKIMKEWGL